MRKTVFAGSVKIQKTHISQFKASAQAVNHILSQIRVVRVPNQANGDDLWRVHQHTTNTDLFPAVTLRI